MGGGSRDAAKTNPEGIQLRVTLVGGECRPTPQGTERRKNIVGQLNVLSSALAKNPFPCMERNPRRESYWKGLITDIFQQPITNKLTHKQL